MQDIPRVTNPSDISLGDVSVGISLGLQPRDISTLPSPREISYGFVTLGKSCYNISVSLSVEMIGAVDQFKYLGIIDSYLSMFLDEYLLFQDHVEYIVNRSTVKLGLLYTQQECSMWEMKFNMM